MQRSKNACNFSLQDWEDFHTFVENLFNMKKVYKTELIPNQAIVNLEDGEVISAVAKRKCETLSDFIVCYLDTIPEVWKLDGNALKILTACWKFSTYNAIDIKETNTVFTNSIFKNYARREGLNISDSGIDKSICVLAKKGFLVRRAKGCYYLNPKYFFRGKLSDRSKLQYIIEYNQENPNIKPNKNFEQ